MTKGGVYQILCTKNGRHYYGRSKNIDGRLLSHRATLIYNVHTCGDMQRDFNRYGDKFFKFKPIKRTNIFKTQCVLEKKYLILGIKSGLLYNSAIVKEERNTKQIAVSFNDKMENKIKISARNKGLTKAAFVRKIIINYMDKYNGRT